MSLWLWEGAGSVPGGILVLRWMDKCIAHPCEAPCISVHIHLLCLCGVYLYLPWRVSGNLFISLKGCPHVPRSLCVSPLFCGLTCRVRSCDPTCDFTSGIKYMPVFPWVSCACRDKCVWIMSAHPCRWPVFLPCLCTLVCYTQAQVFLCPSEDTGLCCLGW